MATFWETTHDDGLPTHSTNEQLKTEDACRAVCEEWINPDGSLSRESCASRQRVNDSEPCAMPSHPASDDLPYVRTRSQRILLPN